MKKDSKNTIFIRRVRYLDIVRDMEAPNKPTSCNTTLYNVEAVVLQRLFVRTDGQDIPF
jgi:hypothetical protein